jgi:hypothetical protein
MNPLQICYQEYGRHLDYAMLHSCLCKVPVKYWNPPTYTSDRWLGNVYGVYNLNVNIPSPRHSLTRPAYFF